MKVPPKGYLPTLDGWRTIAILSVMVAHGADAVFSPGMPGENQMLLLLTRFGAKGVDLFFGISGFLICSRLIEERGQLGTISLRGFYIRRFLRILPAYWLLLAVLGVLSIAGMVSLNRTELIASVLFWRNYVGLGWFTGHLWSLAVEEHFYLIWPALLVLLLGRNGRATEPGAPAPFRRALVGAVLFALAIGAWRVIEFRLRLLERVLPGASFYERTDIRLDALLWGCALALALQDRAWKARLQRYLRGPGMAIVIALLGANLILHFPLMFTWQAILIPLLLAGTVLNPGSALGRFLETRPMRWIGRISYSLYLWQQLFLLQASIVPRLGPLQALPLSIAAAFAGAALSYYVVERPMMKLGHRLAPPTTEGRA